MNNHINKHTKIKGFTLSEILLVLTVIGVVASLTIPTVIQKMGNDQLFVKLKKEYSTLSQAYGSLQVDAGGSISYDSATWGTGAINANVLTAFTNKINFIKTCPNGCWPSSPYFVNKSLGYAPISGADGFSSDGAIFDFRNYSSNCTSSWGSPANTPLYNNICGFVIVDVNGQTSPNQYGHDVHSFWITSLGIFPMGTSYETNVQYTSCDPTGAAPNGWGYGCTGKVLSEGAIKF